MLEPIRSRFPRIPELVMREFVAAMEDNRLRVGEELPSQRELAETLGISRTSLRESLAVMEVLGIVEQRGCRKVVAQGPEYIRRVYTMISFSQKAGSKVVS